MERFGIAFRWETTKWLLTSGCIGEKQRAALVVKSGKTKDIFEGIKNVLDDFKIWSNVKLIIADTTNTNIRCKNGEFTPQTCDKQCFNGKCDQSKISYQRMRCDTK